jgi:hypothetical protein
MPPFGVSIFDLPSLQTVSVLAESLIREVINLKDWCESLQVTEERALGCGRNIADRLEGKDADE